MEFIKFKIPKKIIFVLLLNLIYTNIFPGLLLDTKVFVGILEKQKAYQNANDLKDLNEFFTNLALLCIDLLVPIIPVIGLVYYFSINEKKELKPNPDLEEVLKNSINISEETESTQIYEKKGDKEQKEKDFNIINKDTVSLSKKQLKSSNVIRLGSTINNELILDRDSCLEIVTCDGIIKIIYKN